MFIYREDQGHALMQDYPKGLQEELGIPGADAAFTCPGSPLLYVIQGARGSGTRAGRVRARGGGTGTRTPGSYPSSEKGAGSGQGWGSPAAGPRPRLPPGLGPQPATPCCARGAVRAALTTPLPAGSSMQEVDLGNSQRVPKPAVPIPHSHVDSATCTADGVYLFHDAVFYHYPDAASLAGASAPAAPQITATVFFAC